MREVPGSGVVTELRWVFRPDGSAAPSVVGQAGKAVFAVGPADDDGRCELTLIDGTRVWARRSEIVAR